jgi:hypothetical protein
MGCRHSNVLGISPSPERGRDIAGILLMADHPAAAAERRETFVEDGDQHFLVGELVLQRDPPLERACEG